MVDDPTNGHFLSAAVPSVTAAPEPRRLRAPQWRAALAVLDAVWTERRNADASLQAWFREHREMGSRDRALVGALVYGVLRDAMRLQRMAGDEVSAATLLALHALELPDLSAEALRAVAGAALDDAIARRDAFDARTLTEAERGNVPAPVWDAWCAQYGVAATRQLAQALNREAPVDLRVNTLKATRAQAQAALAEAGIVAQPTTYAATGLRLTRRAALQNTRAWREGWIEPQDEGSQLLGALLGAGGGERVVDFCAGAGGKTLALGAAMGDRGELWALDVSAARLARLAPRAARAGLTIVRTRALPDDDWSARHAGRCDAVLVDAPCSGSGTWRRNPELRLRPLDLPALAREQGEILAAAARLVRPGGRLVYGTCSVFIAENEAVVETFLREHPDFSLEAAADVLALPALRLDSPYLRLLPHLHDTDGFFAARLVRFG